MGEFQILLPFQSVHSTEIVRLRSIAGPYVIFLHKPFDILARYRGRYLEIFISRSVGMPKIVLHDFIITLKLRRNLSNIYKKSGYLSTLGSILRTLVNNTSVSHILPFYSSIIDQIYLFSLKIQTKKLFYV